MAISVALAAMMGLNEVMGVNHRLLLNFTAGYGFVGIAVSLMGRNHPLGIVLASLLFGALYQGGAELAFEMPKVTRDLVVVIQGLVILFVGALEYLFLPALRPWFQGAAAGDGRNRKRRSAAVEAVGFFILLLDATLRVSVPLVLAAIAGLFSERSGIVDIGLEGKMLGAAFAAAAASYVCSERLAAAGLTGLLPAAAWVGLLAGGRRVDAAWRCCTASPASANHGNQIVSGVAINILMSGLTVLLGIAWFSQGGRTPQLPPEGRFRPVVWPGAEALREVPLLGHLYSELLSGHNVLVYLAFLAVPLAFWVVYRTRFGLRLRAVGENPEAVDTAGISVAGMRYRAVLLCGALCGVAGAYLATAQSAAFIKDMTAGKGFIALAALVFRKVAPCAYNCSPACCSGSWKPLPLGSRGRSTWRPAPGLGTRAGRRRAVHHRGPPLRAGGAAAGRLRRPRHRAEGQRHPLREVGLTDAGRATGRGSGNRNLRGGTAERPAAGAGVNAPLEPAPTGQGAVVEAALGHGSLRRPSAAAPSFVDLVCAVHRGAGVAVPPSAFCEAVSSHLFERRHLALVLVDGMGMRAPRRSGCGPTCGHGCGWSWTRCFRQPPPAP